MVYNLCYKINQIPIYMEISLEEAFTFVDQRLSITIERVQEILSYIYGESLMTHQLAPAMKQLVKENPKWFFTAATLINDVKKANKTNDFGKLMILIKEGFPDTKFIVEKSNYKLEFFKGLI